jgi:hypothetical protein
MAAEKLTLEFEVKESGDHADTWIVGAVDYPSEGEMYVAVFAGFAAEERAREYAVWKNSQEQPTHWGRNSAHQTDATTSSIQTCVCTE